MASVDIPNSVVEIEQYTFAVCTALTSATIPNSVEKIGTCAFLECDELTKLTIPNSVTIIEDEAFEGDKSFEILIPVSLMKNIRNRLDNIIGGSYTELRIPRKPTTIDGQDYFVVKSEINLDEFERSEEASMLALSEVLSKHGII